MSGIPVGNRANKTVVAEGEKMAMGIIVMDWQI